MRSSGDRELRAQASLSDRDELLLNWLADHQVLTTFQICHALFDSLDTTQRRLVRLLKLGLVQRFRGLRPGGGSYPYHYVLGLTGAQLIAGRREEPLPRASHMAERALRISRSPMLAHRLGVNQFFTDLAEYARRHPAAKLHRWWSEQQCARTGAFGQNLTSPVRPDGHGIFGDAGRQVAFFMEWDSGSEPLKVVAAKLSGYQRHAGKGGPVWPVLFWLPSEARERHLHDVLHTAGVTYPVATALHGKDSRDISGAGPAGPVWLVYRAADAPRRLIDLAELGDPAPDPLPPAIV